VTKRPRTIIPIARRPCFLTRYRRTDNLNQKDPTITSGGRNGGAKDGCRIDGMEWHQFPAVAHSAVPVSVPALGTKPQYRVRAVGRAA
jgi:hypothetical protein